MRKVHEFLLAYANDTNVIMMLKYEPTGSKHVNTIENLYFLKQNWIKVNLNYLVVPKKEKFCLPGFVNNNAPPLVMPNRPMLHVECPMYCMEGEQPSVALQRMLSHHLVWKAEYEKEKKRLECPDQCDELEMKESYNDQDDIYEFKSQSPVRVSKVRNVKPGILKLAHCSFVGWRG